MNESSEIVTFNIFISPSFSMNLARLQRIDNGKASTKSQPVKCAHVSINVCEALSRGTLK